MDSKLPQFFRKHPLLTLATLLLLVGAGFGYWRYNGLEALEGSYQDVSTRLSQQQRNQQFSIGLEADLDTQKKLLEEIEGRLFKADDLAENLRYFYELERAVGVRIADVRQIAPAATQQAPGRGRNQPAAAAGQFYRPIQYTLTLQGEYALLAEYLYRLETGNRFYRLRDFQVVGGRDGTVNSVTMNLNLDLLGVL